MVNKALNIRFENYIKTEFAEENFSSAVYLFFFSSFLFEYTVP